MIVKMVLANIVRCVRFSFLFFFPHALASFPFASISFSSLLSRDLLWFSSLGWNYDFSLTSPLQPAQGFSHYISLNSVIKLKLICPISSPKLFRVVNAEFSTFFPWCLMILHIRRVLQKFVESDIRR